MLQSCRKKRRFYSVLSIDERERLALCLINHSLKNVQLSQNDERESVKVLGIETSGDIGGVVLSKDYKIVLSKEFGCMQHSKELVPAIKSAFQEIGWSPQDIDLIAVDVGPGSYTGLRVGVTCAKTLAYAIQNRSLMYPYSTSSQRIIKGIYAKQLHEIPLH